MCGTSESNVGTIYLFTGTETAGVPDTATQVYTTISAGEGQTLQAIYSVPKGFTAHLLSGYAISAANKTADIEVFFRLFGEGWRIAHEFSLTDSGYVQEYKIPVVLPEKSDFRVESSVDVGSARVSAGFSILLIDNDVLRETA